ncbi:MAG: hypothetical protein JNM62_16280 [Flavobacteriales bacterium]|nr:hypothetical protein [Flavobacteriales bacterium]
MRLVRTSLLLLTLVPLFVTCRSKRETVSTSHTTDPRWATIDSLSQLGQYATALDRTQAILEESKANGDWRTEFRAWQYRGQYRSYTGASNDSSLLAIEERAATAGVPLKQLLNSALATGWWQRYEQDRWRVLDRTNTEAEGGDPATWSQATYMNKVIGHFTTSLEPVDTLKKLAAGDLGDLLIGDDAEARKLRPTVYDILAHRALSVFGNSETRITEPAWRFTLNDTKDFDLFEPFAFRALTHRDSTAWEFQALRTYQQLERLHLNDDKPDALVDVTLQRLAFVRERSLLAEKDSLFANALNILRSRLPNDTCQAEVMQALAVWHREQGDQYQRLGSEQWKWENRTARELCNEATVKFPGSYGAKKCARLKAEMEMPALRIEAENAVAPNERSQVAIFYRNVKKVGLRVVKDELVDEAEERRDYEKWLIAQKPVHEWSVELPDDGDLNEHMIEVPVDGLPLGRYSVLVAIDGDFSKGNGSFAHAAFWSTSFAVVLRTVYGEEELLVLDRNTGSPKSGVQVEQWSRANGWDRQQRATRTAQSTTDAEGRVRFASKGEQQYRYHAIQQGEDKFRTGPSWTYGNVRNTPQEELRTFLFTDRAIYRPGQELHFKGIVVAQKGRDASVRSGHRTTVRFFDVNGELVDSANVTTDAFGAFHGKFTTPTGALTGGMRLDEQHGSAYMQVEEYKRPTFEVVFDKIAGTPKLNEQATATGIAKSYAGVPLDGAVVKWNVKRGVRMPWWCGWGWRGLPWGRETEVASGEAVCDAQGKFTITFLAEPDRSFPRASDPSFHFTVNADATDISGETQSGTTSLAVAYRTFDIIMDLGDAIDRETTNDIDVRVRNLNGEEVDVPMDVRIVELVPAADAPRRERLWERPDRVLEGELPRTHLADDPMSWPVNKVVLERKGHRANGKPLPVKELKDAPVGKYRIEVESKAADGTVVKVAKLFTVYDTAIQNTGFIDEAFHVQAVKVRCEPGEKAVLLISSALPTCRVLMEVEREDRIAVNRTFVLNKGQQRIELPVQEGDRGGFAVHFVCVERGRSHLSTEWIDVPWGNKDLQVEWLSFRDKLLPGSKEEWRLRITGPKKEKVAAQLLAVMYDASLDHFTPHKWNGFAWPMNSSQFNWQRSEPFGAVNGSAWNTGVMLPDDVGRAYPHLFDLGGWSEQRYYEIDGIQMRSEAANVGVPMHAGGRGDVALDEMDKSAGSGFARKEPMAQEAAPPADPNAEQRASSSGGPRPIRTDFRETAFFLPDLLTDRDGSVVLRYTTPDALTRWKVMGLAHTKELQLAQFTKEATTSKPLMVVPNLPRFLRHGDRITLTAKINATETAVSGVARLSLFDPVTNKEITQRFIAKGIEVPVTAAPGASAVVAWPITVPDDLDIASVRITATGAGISDGEERPLPILTDKVLVTESLPLSITKAGTKVFTLDKLVNNTSTTLKHRELKLEFTPNPAWYALQALPYLMEFPHECAEQTFSRYYANRLATHIVEQRPAVKGVFEQWKKEGESAFLSALEKNTELKGIVLEETPWLLNAKDEGERKRRVALFFDLQRMAAEEQSSLKKLRDMQSNTGAWAWWSGMQPSRYITQHIVAGFGHLEALKAADTRGDGPNEQMVRRAVEWLDAEVDREHKEFLRQTKAEDRATYVPSNTDVHLLYARSFFKRWPIDGSTRTAVEFLKERCKNTWVERSLQEQAMLALAFERLDEKATAQLVLKSLGERATRSEELGMYWKGFNAGYEWWSFPTETHALLVEAFHEVGKDKASTDQLRQYLLKLKQTTDWKTTKATADACYALLLTGGDWLEAKTLPTILVGTEEVKPDKQDAGTGYFERTWTGAELKPAMGRVSVTTANDGVQWGALHWQYLERMDKVTPHESPFSVRKQVMLKRATEAGAQLLPVAEGTKLMPGDRVTIRIELRTDRYLDYVHMKDQRAAGLEPVEALSGYKWQGGQGYYQSIRDAGMHFFFDRMVPGTHVFEYELKVTHAGSMSNGLTTAMCMYAPEFSSHSEGVRLEIGGR